MQKTEAYEKMTNNRCSLAEHLSAVQTLQDYLEKAQVLTGELRKDISPKLNKLELGYYHGLRVRVISESEAEDETDNRDDAHPHSHTLPHPNPLPLPLPLPLPHPHPPESLSSKFY